MTLICSCKGKKSLATGRKSGKAFTALLVVCKDDMENDMKHFPTLREYLQHLHAQYGEQHIETNTGLFVDFIDKLIVEFDSHFTVFKNLDNLLLVVTQPFMVYVMNKSWQTQAATVLPQLSQGDLQRQLIELQADDELKLQFNRDMVENFWIELDPGAFLFSGPWQCTYSQYLDLSYSGVTLPPLFFCI